MITGEIKSKVDQIWEDFWTGGITNSISVLEQMTYLFFIKMLDDAQIKAESNANLLGTTLVNQTFLVGQSWHNPETDQDIPYERLRWHVFKNDDGSSMFQNVRMNVFPFIKNLNSGRESAYSRFMENATFLIPNARTLLEQTRNELRELVKNLESSQSKQFTLNIEDIVTDGGEAATISMSGNTYKQRVLDYLSEHRGDAVFQKIFRLEQLSAEDISQLERILWEELGSREDYVRYTQSDNMNVAMFIRSVIKVDRQLALQKFTEFLNGSTLNALQMDYLKDIISYVCENGDIEPQTLMSVSPFSDINIIDLFDDKAVHVGKYVKLLHHVITADCVVITREKEPKVLSKRELACL